MCDVVRWEGGCPNYPTIGDPDFVVDDVVRSTGGRVDEFVPNPTGRAFVAPLLGFLWWFKLVSANFTRPGPRVAEDVDPAVSG